MNKKNNKARDKPLKTIVKEENEITERCRHCFHLRNYGGVLYCFLPRCEYEWTQETDKRK